jgi:hypothetical protein
MEQTVLQVQQVLLVLQDSWVQQVQQVLLVLVA